MDIVPLAGMLFSLLIVLIIAGAVLMFPLMRRLGRLMELRMEEPRSGGLPAEDAEALREMVQALRQDVDRLAERQEYTERQLEPGPREGRIGTP